MKTLLKILIPLLLLVFVLAPGVTGFLVETAVSEVENGYGPKLDQGPVNLLDSSFERGWFGSNQTAELSFKDPNIALALHTFMGPEEIEQLPTLLIETRANHGVLPMANPAHGGLRPALAQTESTLYLKYPGNKKVLLPVRVYSSVGTARWAKIVADPVVRQFEHSRGTAGINWAGGTAEFDLGETITYQGRIGQLSVTGSDGNIDLAPMQINGNYKKGQYAFPESTATVTMPKAIIGVDGNAASVSDVRIQADLNVIDGRAVVKSVFTSGALELPEMKVDSSKMSMNYDLDAGALSALYKLTEELTAQRDSGELNDPAEIVAAMTDLVSKGGTVTLESLDIGVGGQNLHVNMNINIPAGHLDPMTALRHGRGVGNFLMPLAVVDALSVYSPEIAGGLEMGAGFGIIEKRGDEYSATIEFEDGILSVNGLPVPLPF